METLSLVADANGIACAARIIEEGGLAAFPTETVYGLGADARDGAAVARIFAAKGRPRFNPLIVHVGDTQAAREVAVFDDRAERLAAAFWPGPLTLVLPLKSDAGISPLVTAGLGSVAVRVPAHPVAQALLRAVGGPVAAPSANVSGRVSPTRAAHVMAGLAGMIGAVLDGGPCAVGVESTILGLVGASVLLRPGGVPVEALEAILGPIPLAAGGEDAPVAPGQLRSHYAPAAPLRLNASDARAGEIRIGFGPATSREDLTLSAGEDLVEAATRLFHILREADDLVRGRDGAVGIAVAPVPDTGLGQAINDRLARAAAPRG